MMDMDQLISRLEQEADEGNYESAMELSRRYRTGDGVEQDEEMAQQYEDWAAAILGDREEEAVPAGEMNEPAEETAAPKTISAEEENKILSACDNCESWEEMSEILEQMTFPELREQREENPFAEIVFWSRYLKSSNEEEVERGIEKLQLSVERLREYLMQGGENHLVREAIADTYERIGDSYKQMVINGKAGDRICQRMWKAYELAEELDESRVEGILFCLEYNLTPDTLTAEECDRRKRLYADQCGISFRVDFANDLYSRGRSIEALDMYQLAQTADDADEQPCAKDWADYMAAKIMDQAEEQEAAIKKIQTHYEREDAEAAYFLARMEENPGKREDYYSKGRYWNPKKYAEKCELQYRKMLEKREEIRRRKEKEQEERQEKKAEELLSLWNKVERIIHSYR
ncbi:MAG: hypothetical protein ACI4W2_10480 [Eubacterium sp.]